MFGSNVPWTADERRKKAIYAIRQMMGSNVFDMPHLLNILGDTPGHTTTQEDS